MNVDELHGRGGQWRQGKGWKIMRSQFEQECGLVKSGSENDLVEGSGKWMNVGG